MARTIDETAADGDGFDQRDVGRFDPMASLASTRRRRSLGFWIIPNCFTHLFSPRLLIVFGRENHLINLTGVSGWRLQALPSSVSQCGLGGLVHAGQSILSSVMPQSPPILKFHHVAVLHAVKFCVGRTQVRVTQRADDAIRHLWKIPPAP